MQTIMLQHQHQLLSGSTLTSLTFFGGEDDIVTDDTPAGSDFWSR